MYLWFDYIEQQFYFNVESKPIERAIYKLFVEIVNYRFLYVSDFDIPPTLVK